jgi:hypothetical protein
LCPLRQLADPKTSLFHLVPFSYGFQLANCMIEYQWSYRQPLWLIERPPILFWFHLNHLEVNQLAWKEGFYPFASALEYLLPILNFTVYIFFGLESWLASTYQDGYLELKDGFTPSKKWKQREKLWFSCLISLSPLVLVFLYGCVLQNSIDYTSSS